MLRVYLCFFILVNFASAPLLANTLSFSEIKDKIITLRTKLNSENSQKKVLLSRVTQSADKIKRLNNKISSLKSEKSNIEKEVGNFQSRKRKLVKFKHAHQTQLAQQLAAAYKTGKRSKLKLLLTQNNPEKISRLLNYHKYLNIAREKKINEIRYTIEELQNLEQKIGQRLWSLSLREEELKKHKLELAKETQKNKQLISRINNSIQKKHHSLDNILSSRTKLNTLINKVNNKTTPKTTLKKSIKTPIKKAIQHVDPIPLGHSYFAQNKGAMHWPTKGKITKKFATPITAHLTYEGVFIKAVPNSDVRAIFSGTVVFSDWFKGKGFMIIINHEDGFMSLYAHNDTLYSQVGDTVQRGEKIALSGESGSTTTAGLYFEIRKNNTPLNPAYWLQ